MHMLSARTVLFNSILTLRATLPPTQATRLLLRAALEDPLNQRFVFLSEACAPLIPAAALYAQLMSEPKSRINACSAPAANLNLDRCAEGTLKSETLTLTLTIQFFKSRHLMPLPM